MVLAKPKNPHHYKLLTRLYQAGWQVEAKRLIVQMQPIDICLTALGLAEKQAFDLCHWVAGACDWQIAEVNYLFSVFGYPPHVEALELGMTPQDIAEYQSQWREVGLEPVLKHAAPSTP